MKQKKKVPSRKNIHSVGGILLGGRTVDEPYAKIPAILNSAQKFWAAIDWSEWWEDFNSVNLDGSFVYASVGKFARSKAASETQWKFIKWYLGAKIEGADKPYPFIKCDPLDWQHKRNTGGYISPEIKISQLENALSKIGGAADRLSTVGSEFTLKSLRSFEVVRHRLDRWTASVQLSPDPQEAKKTLTAVLDAYARYAALERKGIETYALCNGISFEHMESFIQMMSMATQSGINAENQGKEPNAVSNAVMSFARMALVKSAAHQIDLPANVIETIAEAVEESNDTLDNKNNKKEKVH